MTATLCPRCGLSDRVEKVRVAHDSGTEIMRSRLKAPQPREPQWADFESRDQPRQPRKPEEKMLPEYRIPASELFFKGHPNNALGACIIYGFLLPISIIIALLPLADLFLFPILFLSGITPSNKSDLEIYLAIGGWSSFGLIVDIFFVRSWVRQRKTEKQIRKRNLQITEENKRIREENLHIDQENARREREIRSAYEAAHALWQKKQDIWEDKLYYCYRDDVVFRPDAPLKEVPPEKMESLF